MELKLRGEYYYGLNLKIHWRELYHSHMLWHGLYHTSEIKLNPIYDRKVERATSIF
jgi:hypothetical protein